MNEIEQLLVRVPLFTRLPEREVAHLAATLRPVQAAPGSILFHEGERGDHFYIIYAGQMEIIKAMGSADQRLLAQRGPGEFIGEMSLLSHDHKRTASVRAVGETRLLEMSRADFAALLHRQPGMAYEMVRVLSDRLNEAHVATIHDLQEKNRQLAQAYDELREAQAQIIEKEKLERELQVAHNIQMSLLPRKLPALERYQFGAYITPMTAVGGDFYDFIPLGRNSLGIAVGDVSGHGVPAALFMALTVTLLRAEACRGSSPVEVLQAINRQLLQFNDEGMFVTLLYGVLNNSTGEFSYVRAGHELPIVCRANGEVIEARLVRGMCLGLFDDPALAEQSLRVETGDKLLLYTDGVVEAMDAAGEEYGDERLQAALGELRSSTPQQVCERIVEKVSAHSASISQQDDITVVCVQAHG